MPWYFYKKNGSQKIERRDDDQPGIIKMTAVGPTLTAGSEVEAKSYGAGYLYCNGATVLITEFTDLWNAFGTADKYKPTGSPTIAGRFYLPDYRRNVPVGSGVGFNIGTRGGSFVHGHLLPQHSHGMRHVHILPDHTHGMIHYHQVVDHSHYMHHVHVNNPPATGTSQASVAYVDSIDGDYNEIASTSYELGAAGGRAFSRARHTHTFDIAPYNSGWPQVSEVDGTHKANTSGASPWVWRPLSGHAGVAPDFVGAQKNSTDGVDGLNYGAGSHPTTETRVWNSPTVAKNDTDLNVTGTQIATTSVDPFNPNNSVQPYQTCNFIIKI